MKEFGKRLGDPISLPIEVIQNTLIYTNKVPKGKVPLLITTLNNLNGMATADEIIINIYQETKQIIKRKSVMSTLLNMCSSGVVERVRINGIDGYKLNEK